jgi:type II secretory pathway component PulM
VNDHIQIAAIAVSLGLLAIVIRLVLRGRLREEYAFAWLIGSVALLAASIWRQSLDVAAGWLGVYYPPALLLLGVILAVFCIALYFSVVISRQRKQIERLVEEVALLDAEVRERASPRDRLSAVAPSDVVEGAARQRGGAGQ